MLGLGTSLLLTIDIMKIPYILVHLKKKKKDKVGQIWALHPCNNLTTREKTGWISPDSFIVERGEKKKGNSYWLSRIYNGDGVRYVQGTADVMFWLLQLNDEIWIKQSISEWKSNKWLKLHAFAVWMLEAENAQDTAQASLSPAVALWTSSSRMGTMRLSLDMRLYFITKRVKRWHKKVSFCGREMIVLIKCQSDTPF